MSARITFTGNATGDAEIRFTPSGAAVANLTVAVTPREKDGDQWKDGEPAFYRVAAWRGLAENVAESIKKGDRVTVVGILKPRTFEHNGEKRISLDVTADSVALDLMFATARATRAQRSQGGGFGGGQQQADPWQSAPAQPGYDAEPPF